MLDVRRRCIRKGWYLELEVKEKRSEAVGVMKEKPEQRVRDEYETGLDFVEMQVLGFVCSMD